MQCNITWLVKFVHFKKLAAKLALCAVIQSTFFLNLDSNNLGYT